MLYVYDNKGRGVSLSPEFLKIRKYPKITSIQSPNRVSIRHNTAYLET